MVYSCTYFSTITIPQPTGPQGLPIRPRELTRIFEKPYSIVWEETKRLLQGKQALPALVNREAGLLRFVLRDKTHITVFVEALGADRTKVYVRRSRGASPDFIETAFLDEIGALLR